MKPKVGWIVAIVLGVILLLVLVGVVIAGSFRFWGTPMMGWYRGMPMHGYPGMMPFGWGGMLFGGLVWLGVLVLLVLGVVALVRAFSRPTMSQAPQPPVVVRTCPNCSKPVQAEWNNCPYCGTSLSTPSQGA